MGMRHRTRPDARFGPRSEKAPRGTTYKDGDKKISKPRFGFKGVQKIFEGGVRYRPRAPVHHASLTIAHRRNRRLLPIEVRPNVGAFLATSLAYEPCFQIGEPDVIRPLI